MRRICSLSPALWLLWAATAATAAEKVTLNLNWFYVGDHAPYFVALDKGWYDEEGLTVDLVPGKGSADVVKKVDVGAVAFGIADTGTVIAARGEGAEVKVVSMLFDRGPYCMWTLKDSGIVTPKDLAGKKIGTPPGDAHRTVFPALAAAHGLKPESVTFVNITPQAKPSALAGGHVDAVFDFYSGAPFYEKALGKDKVRFVMFADWGVDVYSNAIVTSDKFLAKKPDTVKRFVRASLRGWEFALKDPAAAIAIMARHRPEIDQPVLLANLALIVDLFRTRRYKEHGLGWVDAKKMAASVAVIAQSRPFAHPVQADDVFTNEFLTFYALPVEAK